MSTYEQYTMNSNDQLAQLSSYMGDVSIAMINAATSRRERKDAQKHAEQMALESYNRDVEFWEKVNEYNSPLQKRKRLEEAGISPWTEFGKFGAEAPMIKSPVAETLTPTQGLQLPAINMLANYMQLKKYHMDIKSVQAGLDRQAVETKYKQLETDILQEYKNRQMMNDLIFSQEQQGEARKEWNRVQSLYEEKVQEYQREKKRFEHDMDMLGKYDEKTKQAELEIKRKSLERLEQDIKNMVLEAENIKQKYQIGEEQIKEARQNYEINKRKEEDEKYWSKERIERHKEQGIDIEKDPWYLRKLSEFGKWATSPYKIGGAFGEWIDKEKERNAKIQSMKESKKQFRPSFMQW